MNTVSKETVKKRYLLFAISIIVLIALDQITKQIIIKNIPMDAFGNAKQIKVLGDAFVITHLQNTGSAWGMLAGKTWLLIIFSAIILLGLIYVYHNVVMYTKYAAVRVSITFIIAGAIGNNIDRVRIGSVTDFLYFKLINFPVFNVADIYVTCFVIFLIIIFIFKYRSKDIDIILGDKEKEIEKEEE